MPSLLMPNVGEGVTEGTVVRWLKSEGDRVRMDEPIVEVETDKALAEVPCPHDGVLTRILVPDGTKVGIGTPLAELETAEAGAAQGSAQPLAQPAQPPAPEAPPAPEHVEARIQPAAEPAEQRVPAREGNGSSPRQGDANPPIRFVSGGADAQAATGAATGRREAPSTVATHGAATDRQRNYSPVVMKLAAEYGIDLAVLHGTGLGGRVTRVDVMRYVAERDSQAGVAAASTAGATQSSPGVAESAPLQGLDVPAGGPATQSAPAVVESAALQDVGAATEDEVVPLTNLRSLIAERMVESHTTIPVAWMAVEADVTKLVALRDGMKDAFKEREGINLTFLPFLVEAIVGALQEHPRLNSTFAPEGITLHRSMDIGIAVSTEAGLMVPVIRGAGQKSMTELAHEIAELAEGARARKLAVEQLRGATFTVNNTGAFGSVISQPIVMPGQVAIITTEAIRKEVRVTPDGSLAVRSVMNLAISFDHRALDGGDVGAFMRRVRERVEAIGE